MVSRLGRGEPRFVIPQRPGPYVAAYHKLNASQLHQRLGAVWNGNTPRPATAAAPHTSRWLKDHNIRPWWGARSSLWWAWGGAGLEGLNDWLGVNWYVDARPFIYYTGGQPLMPFDDALAIPSEVIAMGNQTGASAGDWIPLGVFGLLPPGAADYVATIQLAVNVNGTVRGYAVEAATGELFEVVGGLDRSKLRIAWAVPGDDAYQFETSVANLLQSESLVNVYDPVNREVNAWQIVRDIRVEQR